MLTNRSMLPNTVIPEFPYPDVQAGAAWLCDAFGFSVRIMIGNHLAQLNIGDGAMVVIVQGGGPKGRASVMIRVEDVDKHHEHANRHGAIIVRPPKDYPYGERQYSAEDFNGYVWTFSQSIADVNPEDWGGGTGEAVKSFRASRSHVLLTFLAAGDSLAPPVDGQGRASVPRSISQGRWLRARGTSGGPACRR